MNEHTELPELSVGYMDQGLGHGHYAVLRKESGELFANVPFGDKNLALQVVRACNSHKDLLRVINDLIDANQHVRDLSLNRDEAHRGMIWGQARAILDAAKLYAQAAIAQALCTPEPR